MHKLSLQHEIDVEVESTAGAPEKTTAALIEPPVVTCDDAQAADVPDAFHRIVVQYSSTHGATGHSSLESPRFKLKARQVDVARQLDIACPPSTKTYVPKMVAYVCPRHDRSYRCVFFTSSRFPYTRRHPPYTPRVCADSSSCRDARCGHKTTTQRYYRQQYSVNAMKGGNNAMPWQRTGYDRHNI